jgi:hypothetical protein
MVAITMAEEVENSLLEHGSNSASTESSKSIVLPGAGKHDLCWISAKRGTKISCTAAFRKTR